MADATKAHLTKAEKGDSASMDAGAEKQISKGLPLARIKAIMKSSPDAATISQEATITVAKATVMHIDKRLLTLINDRFVNLSSLRQLALTIR